MKIKTLQVDSKLMHKFYEENKDCKTVRDFCETLWPDEFKKKEEWEDITGEIEVEIENEEEVSYFQISHHGNIIITTGRLPDDYKKVGDIPLHINETMARYKVKLNAEGDFRILKRKD